MPLSDLDKAGGVVGKHVRVLICALNSMPPVVIVLTLAGIVSSVMDVPRIEF